MPKQLMWCGFAFLSIIIFGTIAVSVLTAQRQQFNAPLIELAEETAGNLAVGGAPANVTTGSVNMNTGLAPFTIVYDAFGHPVGGNGYLNGSLPIIPIGVLRASKGKEYSAITWQPQDSHRFAAVAVSARNGYVVSARSLRLLEHSATLTYQITVAGCLASLLVLSALYVLDARWEKVVDIYHRSI